MTAPVVDVAANLARVRDRVAEVARGAGRDPSSILIVGVTKTHPPETARAAVAAGLADLGENRVEELVAKQPRVPGARWHLVGRLQRRKVRDVVAEQVLIHGLDRRSLADEIAKRAAAADLVQRVLVQVNVGDDPAKGGCHLDEVEDLVAYARRLDHLTVEGLMTMPPLPSGDEDPMEAARPHFASLRELRDELQGRYPEVVHLSMGMSADLDAAVAEGATMVRVGTAIFGHRGGGPWRPDPESAAQEAPS